MDPNDLRDRVGNAIEDEIEPDAWERCETVNKAEFESLRTVLDAGTERQSGSIAQNESRSDRVLPRGNQCCPSRSRYPGLIRRHRDHSVTNS